MPFHDRQNIYIDFLAQNDLTAKELAERLFISEPTVRRDVVQLKKKGLVKSIHGKIVLCKQSPNQRIPLFMREDNQNEAKRLIAQKAIRHIKDGDCIMLDASTSAYHIIPFLVGFRNLFVITSGAKAAIMLASLHIRCLCVGGNLTEESFSFVGPDAEQTLRKYNADVAFIACHGLSDAGLITDSSVEENCIRRIMIDNSKKTFLLCDDTKFGKTYLHTLCNTKELSGVITN